MSLKLQSFENFHAQAVILVIEDSHQLMLQYL